MKAQGLILGRGKESDQSLKCIDSCNLDRRAEIVSLGRIRYAAAPVGNLRWQAPQPPLFNRDEVLRGDTLPQNCPQSPMAPMLNTYLIVR